MEAQSTTKKPEAGLQPASLPSNSASATSLILLGGAFLATTVAGLTQLFLSDTDDKELQKFAHLIGPGASQVVTALALWLYKRRAKKQFRAYAERKINEVDKRISLLPKRPVTEYREKLNNLEDRRHYWEDLLDKNEFTYIDAD